MKIELGFEGAFAFSMRKNSDNRGSLVRIFDSIELFPNFKVVQASYVENLTAGTLRGLHFQSGEYAENKIVQCLKGRIFDVIVDLRENSPTKGSHITTILGPEEDFQGILVPKNFAHGYITLTEFTSLIYLMDKQYMAEQASGIAWNDNFLNIKWPLYPIIISDKDAKLSNYCDQSLNNNLKRE